MEESKETINYKIDNKQCNFRSSDLTRAYSLTLPEEKQRSLVRIFEHGNCESK